MDEPPIPIPYDFPLVTVAASHSSHNYSDYTILFQEIQSVASIVSVVSRENALPTTTGGHIITYNLLRVLKGFPQTPNSLRQSALILRQ